jgi:predicted transglutaminase-like cysteine proteinase
MAQAITKSPKPIGETAFPRCPPTLRETLLDAWRRLTKALRDPYRPELHYMLGPGPKWREKHRSDGSRPGTSRGKPASGRPAKSRVSMPPVVGTRAIARLTVIVLAITTCSIETTLAEPKLAKLAASAADLASQTAPRREALLPAGQHPIKSSSSEPFGLVTERVPEGELWAKWRGVERRIAEEVQTVEQCRADPENCPSVEAQRFRKIVDVARAREGRARIGAVNRAINLAIRPMSDLAQYGVPDLWTAPLETLAAGAGDCEDYAIAKYVALHESGVSDEDLRLLLVRDTPTREDHAVVAARLDGRWLLLDNRWFALVEDGELERYSPMFAIDRDGVKHFVLPGEERSRDQGQANTTPAARK